MARAKSTRGTSVAEAGNGKPPKPYPSFPLFAHASGKWAVKRKGQMIYFGRWDDPQGALRQYQEWVHASERPSEAPGSPTVQQAVNAFLAAKETKVVSGEMARRTFTSYLATGKLVADFFGRHVRLAALTPNDFMRLRADIAIRRNPIGVGNEVTRVKTVLAWAARAFKQPPVDFGEEFTRPPQKAIRRHRFENRRQLFTADELRQILAAADVHVRAWVLLALNTGFNNSDIADFRLQAVDWATGWCEFPRRKTGVPRRFPLWPETVNALKASAAERPEPRTRPAHDRFFLRGNGSAWDELKGDNLVTRAFTALLRHLGIARDRQSFYLLRHCFSDWAQELGDNDAVDVLMGHANETIRLNYRHHFPDSRLLRVTDHVRAKVFGEGGC